MSESKPVKVEQNKPALTKPTFIAMDSLEPGQRVNMHLKV